jgi:hypothetical protein
MYYLTLTDIPITGGPSIPLGTVTIRQERLDRATQVATYALECQGQQVGSVRGWREWQGPWRLAQAALDAIYGGTKFMPDDQLKNNGACNAIASTGKRCRLEAKAGGYFCPIHDRLR